MQYSRQAFIARGQAWCNCLNVLWGLYKKSNYKGLISVPYFTHQCTLNYWSLLSWLSIEWLNVNYGLNFDICSGIMRPSYGAKVIVWEWKNWPVAIISRWRSYRVTFDRENSRECLNWRFYEGGALIKVADSAIATGCRTNSSDIAEVIRESGRSFQSLLVLEKKLCYMSESH